MGGGGGGGGVVRIVFAVRRQSGRLGKNLSCANCRLHIVIIPTSHAIPATQAHEEKTKRQNDILLRAEPPLPQLSASKRFSLSVYRINLCVWLRGSHGARSTCGWCGRTGGSTTGTPAAGSGQRSETTASRALTKQKSDLSSLCYVPVLQIRDILLRIRIRGSVPLTNSSGSCYFHP